VGAGSGIKSKKKVFSLKAFVWSRVLSSKLNPQFATFLSKAAEKVFWFFAQSFRRGILSTFTVKLLVALLSMNAAAAVALKKWKLAEIPFYTAIPPAACLV
jgi:hypothetical protein